jgi:cellulose biosynthesis protein BcsQ
MIKSVAIANHKGGVGKTTLAIILAEIALTKGKKTICVDLDPQENFSDAMGFFTDNKENGKYKEKLLKCGPHDRVEIPDEEDAFMVIDTPPVLEEATMKGMRIADKIIIPVMSDIFSILNLELVYKHGEECGKTRDDMFIVTVGYQQGGIALPKTIMQLIEKRNYKVIAKLPKHQTISNNIMLYGNKWSNGISIDYRKKYIRLYEELSA